MFLKSVKLRELILWGICIFALLKPADWTPYRTARASPQEPLSGMFVVTSGTCPIGFVEYTAFDGKTLVGTLAAHGDVGQTGGADLITPTVASTSLIAAAQTVNSLTAAAQTPNTLTAAAQTVNSLTAAAQGFTGDATTVPALAKGTLAISGDAATTATGSSGAVKPTAAHVHSITGLTATGSLTPLGHNATSAVTGTMNPSAVTGTMNSSAVTGTMNPSAVSGTVTMDGFDNRSAYVKVIYCVRG